MHIIVQVFMEIHFSLLWTKPAAGTALLLVGACLNLKEPGTFFSKEKIFFFFTFLHFTFLSCPVVLTNTLLLLV